MTIWNLYDKAVTEVDADRLARINEVYVAKLEARIKELEERVWVEAKPVQSLDVDRIDALVQVLNNIRIYSPNAQPLDRLLRIKILRTAFGLGLKEAKDAIENGCWTVPEKDDGYDDLPF